MYMLTGLSLRGEELETDEFSPSPCKQMMYHMGPPSTVSALMTLNPMDFKYGGDSLELYRNVFELKNATIMSETA